MSEDKEGHTWGLSTQAVLQTMAAGIEIWRGCSKEGSLDPDDLPEETEGSAVVNVTGAAFHLMLAAMIILASGKKTGDDGEPEQVSDEDILEEAAGLVSIAREILGEVRTKVEEADE